MKYHCLYPVEIEEDFADFSFAGVGRDGQLIEEPWDHGFLLAAVTTSFNLDTNPGTKWNTVSEGDIDISVLVSDSRVAFYCEQYDKGSKYYGGWGIDTAIMTAVSRSIAKKRTAGKVLVGHIRYDWLWIVGYGPKKFPHNNRIVLLYTDSDKVRWRLLLNFTKGVDTAGLAALIVKKAALYKLAMTDEKKPEDEAALRSYAGGKMNDYAPPGKETAIVGNFPGFLAPDGGERFRPDPDARWDTVPPPQTRPAEPPLAAPQEVPPPAAAKPARFCKKCGFEVGTLPDTARFCPKCGTPR